METSQCKPSPALVPYWPPTEVCKISLDPMGCPHRGVQELTGPYRMSPIEVGKNSLGSMDCPPSRCARSHWALWNVPVEVCKNSLGSVECPPSRCARTHWALWNVPRCRRRHKQFQGKTAQGLCSVGEAALWASSQEPHRKLSSPVTPTLLLQEF